MHSLCSINSLVSSEKIWIHSSHMVLCPLVMANFDFRLTKKTHIICRGSYKERSYHITIPSHMSFQEWWYLTYQPIRKHNWPSSHVKIPNDKKITNNVQNHLKEMFVKFAAICSSIFWKIYCNVEKIKHQKRTMWTDADW